MVKVNLSNQAMQKPQNGPENKGKLGSRDISHLNKVNGKTDGTILKISLFVTGVLIMLVSIPMIAGGAAGSPGLLIAGLLALVAGFAVMTAAGMSLDNARPMRERRTGLPPVVIDPRPRPRPVRPPHTARPAPGRPHPVKRPPVTPIRTRSFRRPPVTPIRTRPVRGPSLRPFRPRPVRQPSVNPFRPRPVRPGPSIFAGSRRRTGRIF